MAQLVAALAEAGCGLTGGGTKGVGAESGRCLPDNNACRGLVRLKWQQCLLRLGVARPAPVAAGRDASHRRHNKENRNARETGGERFSVGPRPLEKEDSVLEKAVP